jgi:hypothetical protein
MYHPMLTFAIVQTGREDLERDLRRRQRHAIAEQAADHAPGRRTTRRGFAARFVTRPRRLAREPSPCS